MDTIIINSENSKTSDRHRLLLNLSDKMNLKRSDKCVALSNLIIHYARKNINKWYKKDNFEILAPMSNDKLKLPNGSYSVSDIQDYIEYINQKHKTMTYNPQTRTIVNETENTITST